MKQGFFVTAVAFLSVLIVGTGSAQAAYKSYLEGNVPGAVLGTLMSIGSVIAAVSLRFDR